MRLGVVTGLAISSTLVWAYDPRVYLLSTRGMLGGSRGPTNSPLLTLPQTNKVLANHLGLDKYESLEDYGENREWQDILKSGVDSLFDEPPKNTMMFVLYTDRPQDLASMPTFNYFPENPTFYINSTLSRRDISALLTNYAAHARQDFTTAPSGLDWHSDSEFISKFEGDDIIETFKVPGKSAALFLEEIMAIQHFRHGSWARSDDATNFATFEITALDLLAEEYGHDSEQYRKAVDVIEWLSILGWHEGETYSLIVTPQTEPAGHSYHQSRNIAAPIERRAPAPGSLPIYSCFQSAETCGNATSACSGRGSCIPVSRAGRTCYTCKCEPSRSQDGMTTTYWAGQQCERKDVSSAFVLLVGTVFGVIVVVFGSVALLYSVGDEKLPGTLTGGAVHGAKHD
ncbi:hypothetical protein RSOLAG22IIIB_11275 [Rhizoctonia solani]|uniref:Vacuolar sorting protein Vps3844 C-terminal domain-containing protein n=1 Tax=Rhizoctonia solani TaxID=456999 RepID=A0A0K6G7S8_9AGAM|nr:hypothetical protein RSOLAG22IIIB_11275 [Rhizoctonia solani]